MGLSGYATPPLAGLGVAMLIDDGKPRVALILTIVVLGVVLRVCRGPVWALGWLTLNGWALWTAAPLLWP